LHVSLNSFRRLFVVNTQLNQGPSVSIPHRILHLPLNALWAITLSRVCTNAQALSSSDVETVGGIGSCAWALASMMAPICFGFRAVRKGADPVTIRRLLHVPRIACHRTVGESELAARPANAIRAIAIWCFPSRLFFVMRASVAVKQGRLPHDCLSMHLGHGPGRPCSTQPAALCS
jgi:hypothetical protein